MTGGYGEILENITTFGRRRKLDFFPFPGCDAKEEEEVRKAGQGSEQASAQRRLRDDSGDPSDADAPEGTREAELRFLGN